MAFEDISFEDIQEDKMKIGVSMAFGHFTPPESIVAAARLLDEAGLHSVWVPEHVLFFPEYASRYPYAADGKIPGNPRGILDPFSALTFIAAATRHIRLGTGICLVPQRNPVYTARVVADLDFLSGGRFDFGVGVGWLKEEFDNLQMDFAGRGRRTLEYIGVMRALWAKGVSEYKGETYDLQPCYSNPKPVQQPHPPIFFGGESAAALRRVASHGDGWYGYGRSPGSAIDGIAKLKKHLEQAGRKRADLQIYIAPDAQSVNKECFAQYADADIDQLIVALAVGGIDRLRARIDEILAMAGG